MGSVFDLGPRARRVLAAGYVLALIGAVSYGQLAPDHVFGFQMFNESSSIKIQLFREVARGAGTELVAAPNGEWDAADESGAVRHFSWRDRVRIAPIRTLGTFVHASYGLDAQLYRLEHALDDVARHLPADRETRALVAVVDTLKNGRAAGTVRFRAVLR